MTDDDLDAFKPEKKTRKAMRPLDHNDDDFKSVLKKNSKSSDDEVEEFDDEGTFVKHNFNVKTRQILEKCGVPRSSFLRAGSKINLEESVHGIAAELHKTKLRKISVSKQIRTFEKIMENPLWGSYLYVISSFPSDLRAKQIALSILHKAHEKYYQKKANNKILMKRSTPVWHNVMGGFKDTYLERDLAHPPALMVLSNVVEDSSQTKFEKLRDLLAMYENIPIIVVTSALDPVTLMLGKLRHHGDAFLYIGPDDKDLM